MKPLYKIILDTSGVTLQLSFGIPMIWSPHWREIIIREETIDDPAGWDQINKIELQSPITKTIQQFTRGESPAKFQYFYCNDLKDLKLLVCDEHAFDYVLGDRYTTEIIYYNRGNPNYIKEGKLVKS